MTTDFPRSRTEQSLARVWQPLAEEFKDAFKLSDILSEDLLVRKEPDVGVPVVVAEASRDVPLEVFDSYRLESMIGLDRLGEEVRALAGELRVQLVEELVKALMGAGQQVSALPAAAITKLLDGEHGVLWLHSTGPSEMDAWAKRVPAGMPIREMDSLRPHTRAILFPVSSDLIARVETIPLALSWDTSADPKAVRLHAWCRYQLVIRERAKGMIWYWLTVAEADQG